MKVLQFVMLFVLTALTGVASATSVKVFTDRPADRLAKAMTGFTAQTGVQVEVVVDSYSAVKAR